MPTFLEAKTALWTYARHGQTVATAATDDIVATRINQACERLMTAGNWTGTESFYTGTVSTFTHNGETVTGIELPAYLRTVLKVADTTGNVGIKNRWYQTKVVGSTLATPSRYLLDIGDSADGLRRYLTPRHEADDSITIQAKRRHVELSADGDEVYPPNLGAIKLAMLAVNYEDAGSLESAAAYWAKAMLVLHRDTEDFMGDTAMGEINVTDPAMTEPTEFYV